MVFNATFNNISVISYRFYNFDIGGGNRRKSPTCYKGGGVRVGLWWFTPTWFVDDVSGNLVDDNITSVLHCTNDTFLQALN
jgi:hypothetical protein